MSDGTAEGYAKSLAEGIWADTEASFPFGKADCEECSAYGEDECTGTDCPEREPASAYDYLGSVLDIEYTVSSTAEYLGARILVAFGGPNAWIDTRDRELIVAWWSAPVRRELPREFCDELDEALAEMWESR